MSYRFIHVKYIQSVFIVIVPCSFKKLYILSLLLSWDLSGFISHREICIVLCTDQYTGLMKIVQVYIRVTVFSLLLPVMSFVTHLCVCVTLFVLSLGC